MGVKRTINHSFITSVNTGAMAPVYTFFKYTCYYISRW